MFRINDPVRLQNPHSKKWDIKGVILEIRTHPNGNPSSYIVRKNTKEQQFVMQAILDMISPLTNAVNP